jgi:hypothetical protein
MVRWLFPILLIAMSLAALPGRVSLGCDEQVAQAMGCGDEVEVVETAASSCCATDVSPSPDSVACAPSSTSPREGEVEDCGADADHACSMCAIVCGALCERASPWGLLGIGLGTDGLTHGASGGVLLPMREWLPREASERFPAETALVEDWLTFDRLRRQAKLCLWTV